MCVGSDLFSLHSYMFETVSMCGDRAKNGDLPHACELALVVARSSVGLNSSPHVYLSSVDRIPSGPRMPLITTPHDPMFIRASEALLLALPH